MFNKLKIFKMKKNFKFMLVALMAFFGYNSAFAQRNVGDIFPADNFVYQVTAIMDGKTPGEVTLIGIRDGKNPVAAGALVIPNDMSADLFGDTYTFNVTALGLNALQQRMDATGTIKGTYTGTSSAQTIEFPAHIKEIPANCFNGWTNVKSITFAAGSELEIINNNAFATTQITKFDFSPCSQLAALPDEVFVEAGKKNTYIEEITLPEDSKLLKDIQGAFKNLPNLTTINNLEKSSITQVVANAFDNDAKLTKVELPGTVQTIAANAFKNCGVSDLTINVESLITAGDGATQLYGTTATDLDKLTKLTLKGNLGGIITTNAFKGHTNLATLDLSGLNFASLGQIATSAFEGCTEIASVTIGNINDKPAAGCTIDADAFKDCTKLATVTIGDINSKDAIGAAAFGNKLKTVTIGSVKAGGCAIVTDAFVYANVAGATLSLAAASGKFLSSDDALTPIFDTDAFNFDAIDGSLTGWVDQTDAAVITVGEILSKGGVFAGGDFSGDHIRQITFAGDIAQGGIDAQVYDNTANASSLWTINFNGNIATGGIEANAFANLGAAKVTITFAGSLAKEAIQAGAFEGLYGNTDGELGSQVKLTGTPVDATVNPFEQEAFQVGSTKTTARTIWLTVTNTELLGRFKSSTKGLKSGGAFDVFRVDFYVEPEPEDLSFMAYVDKNNKDVAWARWELGYRVSKNVTGTLPSGTDLVIKRVQELDGANAKVTLYATYTDEDDDLNASTIYMVPLKVKNGFYHIPGTNKVTIIAKVEKASGEFSADQKVKVNQTGWDPYDALSISIWPGLVNTELYVANNIITNQQLIDKNSTDIASTNSSGVYGYYHAANPIDIYRGGGSIVEDLYIMTDPAKHNGFRIDKIEIVKATDGDGAYINKGWYYMLLKHYNGAAAAARVVWMDDAEATAIYGVKEVKTVTNDAIYNLAGQKVNASYKGVVIKNGKKYIQK
jgi:hypothetical protein